MIELPLGAFYQKEETSLEQLLFYCNITEDVWLAFSSWIIKQNISMETSTQIYFAILNHMILMAKAFIYKCKLNKTKPTLRDQITQKN